MFYGVYNYKQAVLQEMEAQGWHLYDTTQGEPSITDSAAWLNYFEYLYYKDFYNMEQIGPVLVPISEAKEEFKKMRVLITGESLEDISDNDISDSFSPFNEIITSKDKISGESDEPVIGIGSRLQLEVNSTFDINTEGYSFCIHNRPLGRYEITSNKETFFNNLFRGALKYIREDVGYESFMTFLTAGQGPFADFLNYVDNDGIVKQTKPILWNKGGWPLEGFNVVFDNYLYKGKNPPRVQDTDRNTYYLYMKFRQYKEGQLLPVYHYYPLTPFMAFDSNSYMTRYGYDQLNYSKNSGLPFSFQPFNYNISARDNFFVAGNSIALPPIAFNTLNQLPIMEINGDTEYWHSCQVIPELAIKQYLYLIDVPTALFNQSGSLTPAADLYKGAYPFASTEEGGEGGSVTPNPGGTTTGGSGKGEITPSIPSDIRNYPISQHLLSPGFYGGIYIPTYRYIIELGDNIDENDIAVEKMNEIIQDLTNVGKLDAIVENFITYSGFINYSGVNEDGTTYDYRYKLPYIPVDVLNGRPLFMCGYDSASSNSYIPKNNKLLTYPYISFEINGYGEKNELKFENWYGNTPQLRIVSKFQPGAGIFLYPKDYDGILDNYDAGVTGQPLPLLSYTKDQYKNEYNACVNSRTAAITSLNETSTMQVMTSVLNAGLGAAGSTIGDVGPGVGGINYTDSSGSSLARNIGQGTTGLASALLSKHQGLREFEAQLKDVENRPLAIANQNAAPSIPAAMNDSVVPFVVWKSIRKEFAMKIDEFFTRYGYRVNKFKEVNIHTRPVFNFLKCSQARVEGSIPNDDLLQIKTILEKGITFWHDTNNILNYNINNPAPKKDATVYLQPSYKQ